MSPILDYFVLTVLPSFRGCSWLSFDAHFHSKYWRITFIWIFIGRVPRVLSMTFLTWRSPSWRGVVFGIWKNVVPISKNRNFSRICEVVHKISYRLVCKIAFYFHRWLYSNFCLGKVASDFMSPCVLTMQVPIVKYKFAFLLKVFWFFDWNLW